MKLVQEHGHSWKAFPDLWSAELRDVLRRPQRTEHGRRHWNTQKPSPYIHWKSFSLEQNSITKWETESELLISMKWHYHWSKRPDFTNTWYIFSRCESEKFEVSVLTSGSRDVRPTCSRAYCTRPWMIPFMPNPNHVLCEVHNVCSNVFYCPWRNHIGRNHTLRGPAIDATIRRKCCLWPLHDQSIVMAGEDWGSHCSRPMVTDIAMQDSRQIRGGRTFRLLLP